MSPELREKLNPYRALAFDALIAGILFVAIIGAFLSMIELDVMPSVLAVGAAVIVAEFLFAKSKLAFAIVNAALAVAVIIAFSIAGDVLIDGLKLIANQVFSVSEKYYAYIYDKFTVKATADEQGICIKSAFLLLGIFTAVVAAMAVRSKNAVMAILLFVICTASEVYYGTSPSYGWNIALYASIGLLVIVDVMHKKAERSDKRTLRIYGQFCAICIALVLLFTGIIGLVYPKENNTLDLAIDKKAQAFRNQFDEQLEKYQQSVELKQEEQQKEEENKEDQKLKEEQTKEDPDQEDEYDPYEMQDEGSSGSEAETSSSLRMRDIIKNILIILLVTGLFLVLPVWIYTRYKEAKKEKDKFDDECCATAIESMFCHMIKWLKIKGLRLGNCVFSDYADRIEELLSLDCRTAYMSAVCLWQEARYSEHEMSEKQRAEMRACLERISADVWETANIFTRFKIKFYYFL